MLCQGYLIYNSYRQGEACRNASSFFSLNILRQEDEAEKTIHAKVEESFDSQPVLSGDKNGIIKPRTVTLAKGWGK
ncbi:hypothetical protein CR513_24860, partial [Mucuna pruriens]